MKYFYWRKSINGMLSLVPPSFNAMQPAVAKLAHRPNQPQVDIGNTGKLHDDALSVL